MPLPSSSTGAASRRAATAAAFAAALTLLAACGGGDGAAEPTVQPFNAVVTAAGGAATMDGAVERTKGYLKHGASVLRGAGIAPQQAMFRIAVPQRGHYEVYAWWPESAVGAGAIDARVDGVAAGDAVQLDQTELGGQWNLLGVHELDARGATVVLRAPAGVRLYADAVRVRWVGAEAPPLALATTELPLADKDDAYTAVVHGWAGRPPYRYAIVDGDLPDGLDFDGATGTFTGVPSQAGSHALRVRVTDRDGRTAEGALTIDVVQSNDTPGSVPPQPFRLQGDRKVRLDAGGSGGPELGALPGILRAMPEGAWAKVNVGPFSDAWVPAELRNKLASGNPPPSKIITAWSSFAWDSNRGNLILYGGGHANYRGNEIYLWRAATQRWERGSLPSAMVQNVNGRWNAVDSADAAPASAHTYDNTAFLPGVDRLVVIGGAADSNGGLYLRLAADGGDRATGLYLWDPSRAHPDRVGGTTGSHVQREGPFPEIVGGQMWSNREMYLNDPTAPTASFVNGCSAVTKEDGKDVVIYRNAVNGGVYKLTMTDAANPASDVWRKVGRKWNGSGTKATCSYDPVQQLLLRTSTQTVPFVYWPLENATSNTRDVNVTPADPTGTFMPALARGDVSIANCGLEFDPRRRNYKLWCGGGGVWQLTPPATVSPNGWTIVPLTPVGTPVPDPTVANGVLGKWKYIEQLDAFMALQDSVQGNVWLYKPVGWIDPGGGGDPPPVNQAPMVALTQPFGGASYVHGSAVALAADAADADGTVVRVEFFAGTERIADLAAAPYAASWTAPAPGSYAITARATDNGGRQTTSTAATITVAPAANAPPTVAVTQPGAGAVFTAGTSLAIVAEAGDGDGRVVRVDFYAGVVKIGEATAAPFSMLWSAPVGTHSLTAIAYDDGGAQAVSAPVMIRVDAAGGGGDVRTVTIQRGVGTSAVADVYLSSYSKSKNYGAYDSLLELTQYNSMLRMAIFHSEGGPVPNGATIDAAVLSFYKSSSYSVNYGVHRMLLPWSETQATWNQRLTGEAWTAPGGKVADADYAAVPTATAIVGYDAGWLSFDVTAHVQQMSSTVMAPNHGWRLQPVGGSGGSSLKRFHSSDYAADPTLRPKLVVSYR